MLLSFQGCLNEATQFTDLRTKDPTMTSAGNVEQELLTFIFFLNLHINHVNAVLDIIPA